MVIWPFQTSTDAIRRLNRKSYQIYTWLHILSNCCTTSSVPSQLLTPVLPITAHNLHFREGQHFAPWIGHIVVCGYLCAGFCVMTVFVACQLQLTSGCTTIHLNGFSSKKLLREGMLILVRFRILIIWLNFLLLVLTFCSLWRLEFLKKYKKVQI